jgi:hypothetical protein
MKIFATIIGSALVLAAGTGAAVSGTTVVRSGLHGVVTRGPVTPICTAEERCSEPAAGAVLVFSRSGSDVARAHVHPDGTYRITLPTGIYTIRVASLRPLEPQAARVIAGRYRHVDFSIDTGIR